MKKLYVILLLFLPFFIQSQIITFTDLELKNKLLTASPTTYVALDSNGNSVAIDTNTDNEIDVSEAQVIYELDISSSNITDLTGLENFINLTRLEVNLNYLTTFDGTAFTNLEYLNFSNNNLNTVNLTGLSNLQIFWAFGNPFTSIDVSSLSALDLLDISYCDNLTSLDVSNLTNLTDLSCSSNDLMTSLNVSGCIALEDLNCQYSAITSLDLSGLSSLSTMFAEQNNINSIDVTGAVSLGNLNIAFNQITSLTVHDLPVLQSISATGNMINNFDIQNCPFFFTLVMEDNLLTTLDLSQVPNTTIVQVNNNLLDTLILAEENEIVQIQLSNNLLTEIDLNNCINLNWGSFNDNPNLESVFMKNGSLESLFNININNLPNLEYICTDAEQLSDVQIWLINNGYSNVNVNTYCSFVPGGSIYEIEGQSRFDFNNDGCTNTDPIVPFMNYTINDGTTTESGFANSSGYYYIPVQAGDYTITPIAPNPALFDVVPTSFDISFPNGQDIFMQDICFTANSVVNDLQVILTPLTPARPGFDADYNLLINNVGNQVLSGDLNLAYQESIVTYVDSDIPFDTSDASSFTWNFIDLAPFQSLSVNVTFNVNPPTDPDFPVNIDDILTYTATVNPVVGDANPDDNIFILNQTVVGSFDPNDIQCLEGDSILLEDVGEYVHYRIRFENTGTFPAENIVVKNIIDTQKFNMSSLQVLNGSHDFVTKIIDNQIEFVFEGVNLPFDDATNDGFVLYKIRTLPTLSEGDIFTNNAEIYFDFNFPIETNDYHTEVIENLSVVSFVKDDFAIYPNPTADDLIIKTEQIIEKIQIYNALGMLIKELRPNNTNNEVSVSDLTTGIYIIQIQTGTKKTIRKFIKE
ncbi:T9SS type A sorting domain-containing protein [Xanthomarina spongicola]|uniref:Putative repeat protein (TIGR01451 family)/predicted secreted protein (Por secretion system target) n=1 Tax=Xanthomarina spongicola TaxID=570520 RepID=A0A316DQ36_9FLAO|nr:T9SS type A sorting domain-containing protein [Xanthomarina spongicola]PWK19598.1 putative repeat protein (TIGR01451 family)/predicted secreted protein (Por secretion system target) [Xanthomarina spongicola]